MAPEFLDRFSRGQTLCHRLPAAVKLVLALGVIGASLCVGIENWPVHGCLFCLVFALLSLSEIPLGYLLQRLLLFIPFVLLLSISVPAAHNFTRGWELTAGVLVRSTLSFTAGLWLVNVTPFDRLLALFRQLGLPLILVAILAFMYRYCFVVFDELQRMKQARLARSFGRARGWWSQWGMSAELIGMLLIRSLERAERVHGAMCARGWDGHVRSLNLSTNNLVDRPFRTDSDGLERPSYKSREESEESRNG